MKNLLLILLLVSNISFASVPKDTTIRLYEFKPLVVEKSIHSFALPKKENFITLGLWPIVLAAFVAGTAAFIYSNHTTEPLFYKVLGGGAFMVGVVVSLAQ